MAAKNWLVGRDLTALTVYTGVRAETGVITWSAASLLSGIMLGQVDYIRVGDERMLEMIASVDDAFAHYELTLMDSNLVVGEILSKKTSGGSILAAVAQAAQFVKVVFVRGLGTYTYLGTIQGFNDGVVAYGKNCAEMTLKPVNAGSAPLVFSGT